MCSGGADDCGAATLKQSLTLTEMNRSDDVKIQEHMNHECLTVSYQWHVPLITEDGDATPIALVAKVLPFIMEEQERRR